ncbi:hypothetical protein [Hymenobacter sp. IS2118]|uniref:hypothetical protein n=1 Tax=Hymenobacter sp. IS2118 TaxID=1505605 RepID=UPI0013772614|nr:hypothetical protein [Hymenobacter sp. IS2118]
MNKTLFTPGFLPDGYDSYALLLTGQVERLNRTLKATTVKVYHYETAEALDTHLHFAGLSVHQAPQNAQMARTP